MKLILYWPKTLPACLLLSGLTIVSLGCDDDIKLSNLPGHITFVGPTRVADASTPTQVETFFGVSDPEGDFVRASVEICIDGGSCYVPELLPGSATLDTLPSTDPEESTALRLLWTADCAVHNNEDEFVVRMEALRSDIPAVEAPATRLSDIGAACQ